MDTIEDPPQTHAETGLGWPEAVDRADADRPSRPAGSEQSAELGWPVLGDGLHPEQKEQ